MPAVENVKSLLWQGGAYRAGSGPRTVGLGDSITAGHHLPGTRLAARDSYFDVLAKRGSIRPLLNAGARGEESHEIAQRLSAVLELRPDVLVILAGTNDVKNRKDSASAIATVEAMHARAEATGATVLVGLIPPMNVRLTEVADYNDRLRATRLALIDFWGPLAAHDGRWLPGLSKDGIHPNARGASFMADAAQEALARL